jgi:4-hydroxybenzoate polyprenyltransferase
MRVKTALRLGRVSNLPTVVSNVLSGVALAGATVSAWVVVALCLALALLYTGGMYLNDAFDHEIDARERPDRPIPSGQAPLWAVLVLGLAMLLGGVVLVGIVGAWHEHGTVASVSGLSLAALIVFYDLFHKGNPLSPLLMAGCRALVYVVAAASVAGLELGTGLLLPALALYGYVVGLSYVAKHETGSKLLAKWPLVPLLAPVAYGLSLPSIEARVVALLLLAWIALALRLVLSPTKRNVPRAVGHFIAGISLFDAIIALEHGPLFLPGLCLLAFGSTLLAQRVVPGT